MFYILLFPLTPCFSTHLCTYLVHYFPNDTPHHNNMALFGCGRVHSTIVIPFLMPAGNFTINIRRGRIHERCCATSQAVIRSRLRWRVRLLRWFLAQTIKHRFICVQAWRVRYTTYGPFLSSARRFARLDWWTQAFLSNQRRFLKLLIKLPSLFPGSVLRFFRDGLTGGLAIFIISRDHYVRIRLV